MLICDGGYFQGYLFYDFLYGDNDVVFRRFMREDIWNFNQFNSKPWIPEEELCGDEVRPFHYHDLSNCVHAAHYMAVNIQ